MRRDETNTPQGGSRSFCVVATLVVTALAWFPAMATTREATVEPDIRIQAVENDPTQTHFNGRPIRPLKSIRMRVTAYSPDHRSCGIHADGITASGYSVETNAGKLVAADARLFAFGSLVSVPGYAGDAVVPVLDRGGAIKGNRLDVLYPTHDRALQWGVRNLNVTIWTYDDGRPTGFRRPR